MASGHVEGGGGGGGVALAHRLGYCKGGWVTEVEGGCKDEVGVGVEWVGVGGGGGGELSIKHNQVCSSVSRCRSCSPRGNLAKLLSVADSRPAPAPVWRPSLTRCCLLSPDNGAPILLMPAPLFVPPHSPVTGERLPKTGDRAFAQRHHGTLKGAELVDFVICTTAAAGRSLVIKIGIQPGGFARLCVWSGCRELPLAGNPMKGGIKPAVGSSARDDVSRNVGINGVAR